MVLLNNSLDVQDVWAALIKRIAAPDRQRLVVVLRHASKEQDGNARCGLSALGVQQATMYAEAVKRTLGLAARTGRVCAFASATARTVQTATILSGGAIPIRSPKDLDIPDLGPFDEDMRESKLLAAQLGISANAAFLRLEEHGKSRLGEAPDCTAERLRRGLLRHVQPGKIVLYVGNSPSCNRALGVDGTLTDLELVAAVVADGGIEVVGRIAPEFTVRVQKEEKVS